MLKNKSIFPYIGGKHLLSKKIISRIPPHDFYYEPFFGGGKVFFAKDKAKHSILSDINLEMMLFYQAVRDEPEDLIDEIRTYIPNHKNFMAAYNLDVSKMSYIRRAARFYYLQLLSFSGKCCL